MFKQAFIASIALAAFVPVAASAGEVQNRINNENTRINQGVHSGSLTYGEYHRLDTTADRIQFQRNRDLRTDGGHLTPAQYRNLNREENNLSDRIYFDKHNAWRQ
jgi:hypothetical protein